MKVPLAINGGDWGFRIPPSPPPPHPPSPLLTCRDGEVQHAGGGLQQVGAAGGKAPGNGHDGQTMPALLGADYAVVLGLAHAAVTAEGEGGGETV